MKSDMLSSLPSELTCMILSRLSTPQDLYSVIRASPLIYTGAFTGSRETILRNVVQNSFHSSALPDALTAVKFPGSDNASTNDSGDKQQRVVFLSQLMEEAKAMQHPHLTLAECMALCRLFPSLDFFVRDCSRQFLGIVQVGTVRERESEVAQRKSSQDSQWNSSLSSTELGRLQRGLLRYITFQNLLMRTSDLLQRLADDEAGVSSEEVAALFAYFTPWEIEEIACVHQYMLDRVKKIFDEVEDDFVESVASREQPSSSRYLPKGEDKNADLDSIEAETPFMNNDEDKIGPDGSPTEQPSCNTVGSSTMIFLEREKEKRPFVIEHLATLGFKYLRTLIEADNRQRRSKLHENYAGNYDNFNDALEEGPRPQTDFFREERAGRQRSQKLKFEGDDYYKRNLGWLWANQMEPQSDYYETCKRDLRAWGYVFWDSDRLAKLEILDEPRPVMYGDAYPLHYTEVGRGPSAQQRLRDLGLA